MRHRTRTAVAVIAAYGLLATVGFLLADRTGLAVAFLAVLLIESRRARRWASGRYDRRSALRHQEQTG